MKFPETPPYLLYRLRAQDMPERWDSAWDEFFALYYRAVKSCVAGYLYKANWKSPDDSLVEDLAMQVFQSILTGGLRHQENKGKFRQILSTICHRRVVDFIRKHSSKGQTTGLQADSLELNSSGEKSHSLNVYEAEQEKAFRSALLAALLSALRREVSPRVFMIFELVKIHGESPEDVARQFRVKRGVVDNSIYKALRRLREIAASEAFQEEFEQ